MKILKLRQPEDTHTSCTMDIFVELSQEDKIVVAIRRIIRAVELHSRSLVAAVGLTAPQLAVMKAVRALEVTTPTGLARVLKLSQATVSGIVDRLWQRGFLERSEVDGDRRKRGIRLSPSGKTALDAAPSLLQESFRTRLAALESWEQSLLLASLQRIAALMDAEEVPATPFLTPGAATAGTDLNDGGPPQRRSPQARPRGRPRKPAASSTSMARAMESS